MEKIVPARRLHLTVEVMHNRKGWYVNTYHQGVPTNSYGPLEGPISLAGALNYVATLMKMEGTDEHLKEIT